MELLKGKIAMVTGGTRGIGYAIVKLYLENGASVAICGSRQETVDKALDKLKAENPEYADRVIGLCPDLQKPEEVEKALDEFVEREVWVLRKAGYLREQCRCLGQGKPVYLQAGGICQHHGA